jgi:molecular chaperone GrpE
MTDHNNNKKKNDARPVEVEAQSEMDAKMEEVEEAQDVAVEQPVEAIEELRTEIDALQAELEGSRAKADEYLDGWQRSRAEFANYKKRIERDHLVVAQSAAGRIIKRYLEILDDLERALKNRPQEGEGAAWANGIELIYRKFKSILESEGITTIEAEGQLFDPNLHEAITSEESDEHESGQIIEVLQQGYMLGDRVLRPAMVRVAR